MQSLLNVVLCSLILLGLVIVRLVFRSLRPVETQVKCECCLLFCFRRFVAQMMAERIIKHGLFKVVFVGAIIKPRLEEIFLWTSWFMVMGFLRLIASTVRDRVEFMTFSSANTRTTFVRFYILLALLVATNVALAGLAVSICYPAGLFAVALVLHEVPFFFFFLMWFFNEFFLFFFFSFFSFLDRTWSALSRVSKFSTDSRCISSLCKQTSKVSDTNHAITSSLSWTLPRK